VKRRALVSSLGALLFSAGAAVLAGKLAARRQSTAAGSARLVSLAPALTETLIALGGEQQLVGVSDYCKLAPGSKLPRVGSSLTPRYEAIAALHPSLVLCDDSAGAKRAELSALGPCEFLPWLTLAEVVKSTRRLGEASGHRAEGAALAAKLEARLSKKPPPSAPRVLLLLSYDPDRPAELWFIRRNSLHGAALEAAGARNAVERDVPGLPRLSVEELLKLDPDAVLIIPPPGSAPERDSQLVSAFGKLAPLRAVKNGRVKCVAGTQSVGPSILQLVDAIEAAL
jgi:ABC-type Fe3+-hydroxamate transport system substrate-binding protein